MPIEFHRPDNVYRPPSYSHIALVRDGAIAFFAGQVAFDIEGNVVGENDFQAQVQQAFANVETLLSHINASFHDILKMTVFVVDLDMEKRKILLDALNERINLEHPPANTLIGVQTLARPGLMLEIEVIAHIP